MEQMNPITLDQLQVALAVADEASFSGAARRLGRAQSAVSHAVANLERLLDLRLFERSRRGAEPTPEGRAILHEARGVVDRAAGLLATARSLSSGLEARVALAVDVMFPRHALLEVLRRFQSEFPSVELALHSEALGAVAKLVDDGVCDLGIGTPVIQRPSGLDGMPLGYVEMVGVVSAGHALAGEGKPSHLAMTEAVQIVLTDRSALTDGMDQAVLPGRQWRVADLGTKRDLIRDGFGFGGLPTWLVQDDLDAGALVEIQPDGWMGRRPDYSLSAFWRRAEPLGVAGTWLLGELGRGCR